MQIVPQAAIAPSLIDTAVKTTTTRWILYGLAVLAGTAILTLSAKITVPFYPVPMTMQTFAVMLIAAVYGARLGGATVLAYLGQGLAGLPVFAGTPEKGIGLAYMVGPTGGYLVGFVVAAILVGWLAERGWSRNVLMLGLAMIFGTAVIFAFGAAWLATFVGIDRVVEIGVAPFVLGGLVKCALAAAASSLAWRGLQHRLD